MDRGSDGGGARPADARPGSWPTNSTGPGPSPGGNAGGSAEDSAPGMPPPPRPHRRRATIVGGVVILVGLAVLAGIALRGSSSGQSAGCETAADACQFPASADKGGGTITFDWRLVLRDDRADASVLLMASGSDEAVCLADRRPDGRFDSAVSWLAGHEPGPVTSLTYDTGMGPPTRSGAPATHVFVGRVPPGTATVVVTTADGVTVDAMVGGGYFLARLDGTSGAAHITASDAAGNVIDAIDVPTAD